MGAGLPIAPELLQYTCWPLSSDTAFDYTPVGIVTASPPCNDAAILYYWGPSASSAVVLSPGGSVNVSETLASVLPSGPHVSDGLNGPHIGPAIPPSVAPVVSGGASAPAAGGTAPGAVRTGPAGPGG
jgi:hypothetical protein